MVELAKDVSLFDIIDSVTHCISPGRQSCIIVSQVMKNIGHSQKICFMNGNLRFLLLKTTLIISFIIRLYTSNRFVVKC